VTSWSIRRKLLLLILTFLLPAAGIIVKDGLDHRTRELEDAKHHVILIVESLSAQQERIAAGIRQMLSTLAQSPQVQSLDAQACNKLFRELRDHNPIYAAINASTPDGNMFANAIHFEPGSVNICDRKHFKDAIRTLDFSPGEYVVGRVTNVPSINYGYPVLDAGKRLIAIVSAAFRLTEYDSFIKKANLPQDSAVGIFDHRGVRLYRYPENDAAALGKRPSSGLEQIEGLDEGTFERKSDDGVYRIFAFKRLRLTGSSPPYLLIAAGVPKDKILGKANFAMACDLLILGLAAAIAACLAWFLGNVAFTRPIKRLVSAARRFGGGEMDARTGLSHTHDELGKLAQSFDSMAELLERRNLERKKAEEELNKAFRKNDLILNAAGEGIVGLDEKGTVTFANPAAGEMLGYETEELIGKDLHLMIHHSFPNGIHYPVTECPMWQSLRNGVSSRVRDEVLWKKDGASFPAAYSSTPIIENGQVVGAVVSFRDISVRKKAEEDLQRANKYLENVFENSPEVIVIVDKSGRFIKWNKMAEELYGYNSEELRGMCAFDLYTDKEELGRMLMRLRQEGSVKKCEMMMRKGDGSVVPFEISIALLKDIENRILGSVTVASDLSGIKETLAALRASNDQLNQEIIERKRSEKALKESEERYRILFEGSNHGILAADIETKRFVFANPSICHMLGYSESELLDLGIEDIHPKDSLNQVLSELESQLLGEKKLSSTLPCLRKDGTVFFVDIAGTFTSIHGRKLAVCFFSDVTERRMAQEQIESIARFPDENPNPILRISSDGELLYANRSSGTFLKSLGWKPGETLPGDWRQHVLQTLSSGRSKEMDLACEEVVYSLMLVPVGDMGYVNIYGRDITEGKKAKDALLESETKFKSFAELAPAGMYIVQDGVFKYVNPKFAQMFGYTVEECLNDMPFTNLVYAEDLTEVEGNAGGRRSSEAESVHYTFRGLKKNGQIFHVEVYGSAIVYKGEPAATGTILDITERKKAEDTLRESEERFSRFFRATPVGTSITRLSDGRFADVNDAFLGLFGYTREEVIGQNPLKLGMWANPGDRAKMVETLQEKGRVQDFETQFLRRSGEIRDVSVSSEVIELAGQRYILGLTHDITEAKRAEKALRETTETLQTVIEASPVAIILLDPDGNVKLWNAAAERLFGWRETEVFGQFLPYVSEDKQGEYSTLRERVLRGESFSGVEVRCRKRDGSPVDISIATAPMRDADGNITGIISVNIDITERKRGEEERRKLEEQLFQAQKMESVGRLAGGVAHDFNNMLSVIIGRAEMALKADVAAGELQDNLKEILKAGLRSADFTRQLLGFARKQTAAPKILDLNGTISGMLKILTRLVGEDIDLIWQPGPDLLKVKIDPSQVDQILANLAVNARDAIPGVGAITIKTEKVVIDDSNMADHPEFIPGEYVLLTVSDTGEGMSRQVCENIFEPFFTTKELGRGTGLGLSTVYGIVKQNCGFIYVDSEPGKGTTFKIYLPRLEDETARVPSEEADGEHPTGTETILLVEDDEAILNICEMILENLGYTVLAAPTPRDAIHLVENNPGDIHLLITDVVMPEMNGVELAEQLRAIRPNLKHLYMSGYSADVITDRGIPDDGVNFIKKPFLSDDLAARVRQVLDHLG
jgi:PAS domain S-box-containing protein